MHWGDGPRRSPASPRMRQNPGHFKPHCLYMDIMSMNFFFSLLVILVCDKQVTNEQALQAFVLPARHCLWCITSYFLFFSQLDLNTNTNVKLRSGQVCFLSCQLS